MNQLVQISKNYGLRLSALLGIGVSMQVPLATAQPFHARDLPSMEPSAHQVRVQSHQHYKPDRANKDQYILGPGDAVLVELLDVPEYSGVFQVGPDGTLYIPRLRSLVVEGLTLEDLRSSLTQKFSAYVREPQVFVSPVAYRPIRVYIGGEVQRPGFYYLTGQQGATGSEQENPRKNINTSSYIDDPYDVIPRIKGVEINNFLKLPTVFDALRTAGGVTPFSKLSEVSVTRKRPLSSGGGKIRTQLNFLELITDGNETQNIRLLDGDTGARSPVIDQIIKAGQSNLSPILSKSCGTRSRARPLFPQGLDQAGSSRA